MKLFSKSLLAALVSVGAVSSASAVVITLDFEGLGDLESVGAFYAGGLGGNGSGPGTNFGITFSDNALAIIDSDAGGGGNFGGEPTPDTVLFFLQGAETYMNVAGGFDTGFSLFYSAINDPGFVNVYDGPNGTGNILATLGLPVTPSDGGDPFGSFSPFYPVGVSFAGTAASVGFGGVADQIGFDNITFGTDTPPVDPNDPPTNGVPDGGTTALLLGLGLLGLHQLKRKS